MSLDVKQFKSYHRWLWYHLMRQKLLVIGVLTGITIVTLTRVLIPVILGYIIDSTLITRDIEYLILLLVIILFVYIIRNAMDYLTMMVGHYLGMKTEQYMRQEFFDTIQNKSLNYHDKAQTGDLQALATNDLRVINTMISHGTFYIYPFFQAMLAFFLIIFTLDLRLALICFPFLVLYIAIGTVFLVSSLFVYQDTLSIGVLTSANLLLITLINPTNMIFWATSHMI